MIKPEVWKKWQEQFIFVPISPDDVLNPDMESFEKRAREYAEQGFTQLMFSGFAHWRWSWRPYWPQISKAMGMYIKAIHKYGMKAIEHHSTSLFHSPVFAPRWTRYLKMLKNNNLVERMPGVYEMVAEDNDEVDGIPVASMRQIDGRNGKMHISDLYHTYTICYNNPDFRRIYFKYLEELYALGLDGIMTDDIEIYDSNACTCPHCRKLFQEQTGYDLPGPLEWSDFVEDYNNPVFLAFKRFRHWTTAKFQQDVNDHFHSLGLELSRPNYVFRCLGDNDSAYPLEMDAHLWTTLFQENCYGLKLGHMGNALEAIHRNALGKRHDIPSMSMFYPGNDTENYFGFALAMSWGQLYLGGHSERDRQIEAPLRVFEKKHQLSLTASEKLTDLAVYFSTETRDFTPNSFIDFQRPLMAFMQAAYMSNIQLDMVFQKDDLATLCQHKTILMPHIAMLSDAQIDTLKQYVLAGGRLIITGPFGIYRPDMSSREAPLSAFGIQLETEKLDERRKTGLFMQYGDKWLSIPDAYEDTLITSAPDTTPVMRDATGNLLAVSKTLGKGEVLVLPSMIYGLAYQVPLLFYWFPSDTPGGPATTDAPFYAVDILRKTGGAFLNGILRSRVVELETENPDILAFTHINRDDTVRTVHLVNVADTFVKEYCRVNNKVPVKQFEIRDDNKLPHAITVSIEIRGGIVSDQATLSTPEREDSITLPVTVTENRMTFTVPKDYFSGYALIEIFR